MSVAWLAQGRAPPSPDELRSLVERWVRDEVLFREAVALGLDRNDTIVKRRMVQKMEFLAEEDFGPSFARALLALAPGGWQGPIESGYGWHLVLVESSTPARLPELDEVEGAVRNAWIDARRAEVKRRAYERMRARDEVVLPAPAAVPGEGGE